jgi:C-terminal processing protease CtpA/Prc
MLGPVEVREPVTLFSVQAKGAFTDPYVAGNVGGGVLRRFDITFDYAGKRMWLEPNARDALRDGYDRSGMWVNQVGAAFAVMDVLEGGPAHEAGLRAGDRIVAVDGKASSGMSLSGFRELLRSLAPGTRVRLGIDSAGKARQATLVLRELV